MKFTKHIAFWLAAFAICYLVTPMFLIPAFILARAQSEIGMVAARMDGNAARIVERDAGAMYATLFIESGVLNATSKGMVSQRMRREAETAILGGPANVADLTNGYLAALVTNTYSGFVRLAIILCWLPYLLPFVLAAIVDGLIARKIKLESFKMFSPVSYSAGMHLLIALAFFPLVYLVAPVPVTPMFLPAWAILFSLPSIVVLSNTMRIA